MRRKNKKSELQDGKLKENSATVEQQNNAPANKMPSEQDYLSYIEKAKKSLCEELLELDKTAEALKISSKKLSKVKGVFSGKLSRRKANKHAEKINAYNQNLDAYIATSSRVNWLIKTLSSCYEGAARLQSTPRAASKMRLQADKYIAKIMYIKGKTEKKTAGIVMPVSNYVK